MIRVLCYCTVVCTTKFKYNYGYSSNRSIDYSKHAPDIFIPIVAVACQVNNAVSNADQLRFSFSSSLFYAAVFPLNQNGS